MLERWLGFTTTELCFEAIMSVGMDCETEGLNEGPLPYVVALHDSRANRSQTFISNGKDDTHILESLQAMQNTRNLVTLWDTV